MLSDVNSAFQSICVNVPKCTADNVDVTCGSSSRRRRRATSIAKVNFRFTITLPKTMKGLKIVDLDKLVSTAFSGMTNTMRQQITAGKFNTLGISDLQVDKTSYITQRKKLNCPIGMTPRTNTYSCGNLILI